MNPSLTPLSETAWVKDDQGRLRQEALEHCVLPLSTQSYKGSSGRVGVLGGSARYTGAPYYAAMASLRAGADLSFCFCAEEAAIPIKSYSPELMVAPVYSAKAFDALVQSGQEHSSQADQLVEEMVHHVQELFDKLHVLVIGPGMGRCPLVMRGASRIIQLAQEQGVPLVLDADALFLLTLPECHAILQWKESPTATAPIVLTPNAMERKRLEPVLTEYWVNGDANHVVVVEKSECDVIVVPTGTGPQPRGPLVCRQEGGQKRSGGLGDILAGTLGTMVAWNGILSKKRHEESSSRLPLACWMACSFVKRSTQRAFVQHQRAMTAPDVLAELGPTVVEMTATTDNPTGNESKL